MKFIHYLFVILILRYEITIEHLGKNPKSRLQIFYLIIQKFDWDAIYCLFVCLFVFQILKLWDSTSSELGSSNSAWKEGIYNWAVWEVCENSWVWNSLADSSCGSDCICAFTQGRSNSNSGPVCYYQGQRQHIDWWCALCEGIQLEYGFLLVWVCSWF